MIRFFSPLLKSLKSWLKAHADHDLVDMPTKENPHAVYVCSCGATFIDGGKAMEHISQSQNSIRGDL